MIIRQRASQILYLMIAVFCTVAVAIAVYVQHSQDIMPCVLCMLQRYCFGGVILFSIIAFLHDSKYNWVHAVYGIICFLFSVLGAVFAGRQCWLQHQPHASNMACLPGFNFLIHQMSFSRVVAIAFKGDVSCAAVHWSFLGFSMAMWSLVAFVLVALSVLLALSFRCWRCT